PLTAFLKPLIADPRLAPSCGSFEGPKNSSASASTTMISPIPSRMKASSVVINPNRLTAPTLILPQTNGEPQPHHPPDVYLLLGRKSRPPEPRSATLLSCCSRCCCSSRKRFPHNRRWKPLLWRRSRLPAREPRWRSTRI